MITSATHSLGLRVAKLLESKFDVILATSDDLPSFMQANYLEIPKGVSPTFAHEMLKLALDLSCAYILPLQLPEIESLAESLQLFEEYGIKVICPVKNQLGDLEILPNPGKELPLSIVSENVDLIHDKIVQIEINGLGVISDSEMDFFLVVAR